MTKEIKNLKVGYKNIRIKVGENEIFIGRDATGDQVIKEIGTDILAWLDSHKPIHIYHSINEIKYVYRASKEFTKLCWGD